MKHCPQKLREWVSEKVFFFFSRPLKMSVWVKCTILQRKKNKTKRFQIFSDLKKVSKIWKTVFFSFFGPFFTFFWGHPLFWRVSGLQTFAMKKNFFFFNYFLFSKIRRRKHKSLRNWVNEWVVNFSGEKNYDTFECGKTKSKVFTTNWVLKARNWLSELRGSKFSNVQKSTSSMLIIDSQKPKSDSQSPIITARKPKFEFQRWKSDSRGSKIDSQMPKIESQRPKIDSQRPKSTLV